MRLTPVTRVCKGGCRVCSRHMLDHADAQTVSHVFDDVKSDTIRPFYSMVFFNFQGVPVQKNILLFTGRMYGISFFASLVWNKSQDLMVQTKMKEPYQFSAPMNFSVVITDSHMQAVVPWLVTNLSTISSSNSAQLLCVSGCLLHYRWQWHH